MSLLQFSFKTKWSILNDTKTQLIHETLYKRHHLEQASTETFRGDWFVSFTFSPLRGTKIYRASLSTNFEYRDKVA